jgi:ribosomal protein L24
MNDMNKIVKGDTVKVTTKFRHGELGKVVYVYTFSHSSSMYRVQFHNDYMTMSYGEVVKI